MCVVVEHQAVVADVVDTVSCFHHGAQGDCLDEVLFFLPLDVFKEFVEAFADVSLASFCSQTVAELADEGAQLFELFGIGYVVDAVWERLGLLPLAWFAYFLGDRTVRK